jgi:hypothetical protein
MTAGVWVDGNIEVLITFRAEEGTEEEAGRVNQRSPLKDVKVGIEKEEVEGMGAW